MKSPHCQAILATLSLLILQSAGAATTIASATFTGSTGNPPSLTDGSTLTSITTSEGTFSNLTGAVSSNATGERIYLGADPGIDNLGVIGLDASDGLLNLTAANSNFQFGTTFTTNTRFFIFDATSVGGGFGDNATISLIDATGNPIGTYTFALTAANFGTNIATIPGTTREGGGSITLQTSGTSFALSDFVGTGDLSTATGIRISNASILDPTVVGIYSVPEPSSLLIAALSATAITIRRRHRRQA